MNPIQGAREERRLLPSFPRSWALPSWTWNGCTQNEMKWKDQQSAGSNTHKNKIRRTFLPGETTSAARARSHWQPPLWIAMQSGYWQTSSWNRLPRRESANALSRSGGRTSLGLQWTHRTALKIQSSSTDSRTSFFHEMRVASKISTSTYRGPSRPK